MSFPYFREGGLSSLKGLTPQFDKFFNVVKKEISQFSSTGKVMGSILSETGIHLTDLTESMREMGNVDLKSFTMTSSAIAEVGMERLQVIVPVALVDAASAIATIKSSATIWATGERIDQVGQRMSISDP